MTTFTIHTAATAPDAAKPLLAGVQSKFGFVPNLMGTLADAPSVLKAMLDLGAAVSATSLTPAEQQLVMITTSRLNGCSYCVAAHSTMSHMAKLPEGVIAAARTGTPLTDAKLEALRQFAEAVVKTQGWAPEAAVAKFLAAGYTKANVLEVVLAVTYKVLTNYVNHIADTPLDAAFDAQKIDLKRAS
jgi:uncharacterized peroxidase-related enzyme